MEFGVRADMALWGRDSRLAAEKRRLRDVQDQISEKKKELSRVSSETRRTVSQAEKSMVKLQKEQAKLTALRDDAQSRISAAEKKTANFVKFESIIKKKEQALRQEETRISRLRKEEEALRDSVTDLDETLDKKHKELHHAKKAMEGFAKERPMD